MQGQNLTKIIVTAKNFTATMTAVVKIVVAAITEGKGKKNE